MPCEVGTAPEVRPEPTPRLARDKPGKLRWLRATDYVIYAVVRQGALRRKRNSGWMRAPRHRVRTQTSCPFLADAQGGTMRGIAVLAVAGLALVASGTASAQRVIMGDMISASGTVEKIDKANRQVTLKGADGGQVTVEVSKEAKRFDEAQGRRHGDDHLRRRRRRAAQEARREVRQHAGNGEGRGRPRTPRRVRGRSRGP